jgi:hypothetical protein
VLDGLGRHVDAGALVTPPRCPYCGVPAKLVTGRAVYPHRADLADRRYWRCDLCLARAGADVARDFAPTGRLANADLRAAQAAAHQAFDPLWKSGAMTRNAALRWLATELGLPKASIHFSQFDEALCTRVVALVKARDA